MAQARTNGNGAGHTPRVRVGDAVARSFSGKQPKSLNAMQTDSLENLVSGMGGPRDKSVFTKFSTNIIVTPDQLEAAYRGDWVSRKIIDIPAYDSTREWRDWQAESDQITAIEDLERKFNLKKRLMQAMIKARLYGGGALIIGVNQGKPEEAVNLDAIKKDSLQFVHAVSRYDLSAGPIQLDIMDPYYGEPQYYDSTGSNVVRLHPSRVVRLLGKELPRLGISDGWGDPVLQSIVDAVLQYGSVAQGIANMVQEAQVDVIRIPGLTDNISSKEYEDRLKKRFGLAANAKSLFNMLLLDKEEEWQRINAAFNSLPDVCKLYLETVAGAADIPGTRMLGQSPRGLNATGISDIRNYYDKIAGDQESDLTPAMERLDEVLIRSALGSKPDEIYYKWNPLWQMDDAQKSDIALKKAQAFQIDVNSGVMDSAVMKQARENQLIEDGTYPGLEGIIAANEALLAEQGIDPNQPDALKPPPVPVVDPNAPTDPNAPPPTDPNVPPQKGGQQPPTKGNPLGQKNLPPAKDTAVDDMVTRVRKKKTKGAMAYDGAPKTLYVCRPVVNAAAIIAHYKAQGLATTIPAGDLHATIAYSRTPVDWSKAGEDYCQDPDTGQVKVAPGGMRDTDKFGNALVLCFSSSALCWRWCSIKERTGATWDWPEYQPHLTLTYEAPDGLDPETIEPWQGPIVFGPEKFEEIDPNYKENVVEDALAKGRG